ncbi:MAG TPA: hypothetical protein VG826_20045 [Pirellulales bacterium]|nr:hypothetical protein [Pirellulales bacterium]
MPPLDADTPLSRPHDKQLQGVEPEVVLEKRRLGQALNAKEFAVCSGVSYSTARSWFHLPGFPVFHGVVFWQDFVQWRTRQTGLDSARVAHPQPSGTPAAADLPPRAARILFEES